MGAVLILVRLSLAMTIVQVHDQGQAAVISNAYFQQLNGTLPSCASGPTFSLPSSIACARSCVATRNCPGFNQHQSTGQAGVGCSLCTLSVDNGSQDNNNSVSDQGWFYLAKANTTVVWTEAEVPLDTYLSIPNGLHVGQVITIAGIPTNSSMFEIDFCDSAKTTVPLRVSPRFDRVYADSNFTILRTKLAYVEPKWQPWVKVKDYFPYEVNKPFEYTMLVTNRTYVIYLDGRFLAEYEHRYTDLGNIRYMYVADDVRITRIVF